MFQHTQQISNEVRSNNDTQQLFIQGTVDSKQMMYTGSPKKANQSFKFQTNAPPRLSKESKSVAFASHMCHPLP
jgi:hypothetical protein